MFDLFKEYYIENNCNDVFAFMGLIHILDKIDKEAFEELENIYDIDEIECYFIVTLMKTLNKGCCIFIG